MIYSYFPGCTLRNKAKDLDEYARLSAKALGMELNEPADWQCCGGVYPIARDEIAQRLSAARALISARDEGRAVVTMCSACHNVLKQVNNDLKTDGAIAEKINNYLALENPYHGETQVLHYLEVLRDQVGFDEIKKKVVKPLSRKIAAYYGCLLLRPGRVMALDNPENPRIIEDFITALGGEPVRSPYRNECCGAYMATEDPQAAHRLSGRIADSAKALGAAQIVTACPRCLYNLKKHGDVPVVYFTQLLCEALGIGEVSAQ